VCDWGQSPAGAMGLTTTITCVFKEGRLDGRRTAVRMRGKPAGTESNLLKQHLAEWRERKQQLRITLDGCVFAPIDLSTAAAIHRALIWSAAGRAETRRRCDIFLFLHFGFLHLHSGTMVFRCVHLAAVTRHRSTPCFRATHRHSREQWRGNQYCNHRDG
jgi:hypothetical protein